MNRFLTSAERAATEAETGSARGLPARAYTSSEWAEQERQHLFGPTWACLMFADELAPRHATPIEFLGLPLLAVKSPDGEVFVFHNVCRHRGHKLVQEAGDMRGGFTCPYHNWTYGFDGHLKGTPHIGGVGVHQLDGFDRSQNGLMSVRSVTWLGMVFINLSGAGPAFDDYLEPLRSRWTALAGGKGVDSFVPALPDGETRLEVQANWKLAVENYLESYHLPFIHPGLNSYSPLEQHYGITADDWGGGQGCTSFTYAERAGVRFPIVESWPDETRDHAEYIALYPNLLLGIQVDHLFAMILRPITHDRTEESVRLMFVGEEPQGDKYQEARKLLLRDWMDVFAEDVDVVEGMQAGRRSTAFDGGAFSPFHDFPTHHFHRWVARRHPVEAEASQPS